jgi:hypothetical protein
LTSYYREYIEVSDGPVPFTAEVRMCHDFPEIQPGGSNQVIVLDDRVAELMCERWRLDDMPTDTWGVLVS